MKKLFLKGFYCLSALGLLFSTPNVVANKAVEKVEEQFEAKTIDQNIEKIDRFLHTIKDRLSLMPEVAKWNWNHTSPIDDKRTEELMIESLAQKAAEKGLNPAIVKSFFKGQVEASKLIQIEAFETWVSAKAHKVEPGADIKELSPEIERLNQELISQLNELSPLLKDAQFCRLIKERAALVLKDHSKEVQEATIESLIAE